MREPAGGRFDLTGRVALVTGGSRGIGAAIAAGFAAAGATVVAVSRTGGGAAAERVEYEACDVADAAAREALYARVAARHGRLDALVNAAAVTFPPADGTPAGELDRFRRTLEVDLVGCYAMVLAALPLFERAGGGAVVNVTSINSVRAFPANPGYVASKAGLAGLTRALAMDLAPRNVRVNALAPGYVHTAMTERSHADPALHEQRRRHALLGRWGTPDDMVGAAIFLASPASAFVTGQELFVDGGWTVNGMVAIG
jgi:NAD(P)-dependent dehydrogenase (short-subunit alcohol dehydrogenase family)